jgi:menaquinone-dependent protoporphyrinogen oxidase
LTEAGQEAQTRPVKSVTDLAGYRAFVIGGAVYFGKWLKDGTEFVRRNHARLGCSRRRGRGRRVSTPAA